MAQHTITVSDTDGGISIRVEGTTQKTPAGSLAKAMVQLAQTVIEKVSQVEGKCDCPKCLAERDTAGQAASTEPKPTLH